MCCCPDAAGCGFSLACYQHHPPAVRRGTIAHSPAAKLRLCWVLAVWLRSRRASRAPRTWGEELGRASTCVRPSAALLSWLPLPSGAPA